MTLDAEINPTERFPSDYVVYRINDNIKLMNRDKLLGYYKVTNRNRVARIDKQDTTNWLLAAGDIHNARDVDDWLEPSSNVLMILAFGIYSDRNVEVTIGIPSAEDWYGIKNQPEAPITPSISPRDLPTVTFYAWGTSLIPNFTIKNPSEYTVMALKLVIYGFKYELQELDTPPSTYDTINLGKITIGG